jgi:hypothetical protein
MRFTLNQKRAGWAQSALDRFRQQVGDDDEASLILDLITDLGHLAQRHQLDFLRLPARAISVWTAEAREPDGIDPGPQVSISVPGRRPVYANAPRKTGGRS